jgi:SpoVK/Ycf46/Vps4 family AAA+-type ATPase
MINEMNEIPTEFIDQVEYVDEDGSKNAWATYDGEEYVISKRTQDKLESGLYNVSVEQNRGVVLKKAKVSKAKQVELPSLPIESIINEFNKFWASKDLYTKYNRPHKRGILLHGESGCGKTTLVKLLVEKMKENDGLCFEVKDPVAWYYLLPALKKIEPIRPILAIIEDIDSLLEEDEELLLALLDGLTTEDGVFYITTTNNVDEIPDRIKNRPSRIDKQYKINKPTKEDRLFYFNQVIADDDKNKYDIDTLVTDTENYSLADLAEVIVSLYILGDKYNLSKKKGKKSIGGGTI